MLRDRIWDYLRCYWPLMIDNMWIDLLCIYLRLAVANLRPCLCYTYTNVVLVGTRFQMRVGPCVAGRCTDIVK